jgi:DNA-binding XRE family transcriptional regulator
MKTLKSNHIRAARALLDWNREDLAKKADLSPVTIANIELEKTDSANPRTYQAIEKAFLDAGVVFTPKGVEEQKSWIREVTGEGFFLEILDDIYNTLLDKGGEVLSMGIDDRLSTPEVIQRLKKAKNAGIKMRDIIEEGNTYFLGPSSHYKAMPAEFFKNHVKKIYGDKVFLDFGGRGLVIHNHEIAEVERNQFNLIWKLLPKITAESTANERI